MSAEVPAEGDPRVFLAIERTFLAWTRTALALMGFGFVVARIGLFLRELAGTHPDIPAPDAALTPSAQSLWLGTALVVLGIAVQSFALLDRRQQVRRFQTGQPIVTRGWSLSSLVGLVLIGVGVAMAAYLVRLF